MLSLLSLISVWNYHAGRAGDLRAKFSKMAAELFASQNVGVYHHVRGFFGEKLRREL